jgi:SAM-dependent methyltransferase
MNEIRNAYDRWSHSYDDDLNATRDLDREVTLTVLSGSRFTTIIEAGCGTGKNTQLFSRLAHQVLALDFSSGMLKKARAKSGERKNVSYAVADITTSWPCIPGRADLVTFNLVLEHVQALSAVFSHAALALGNGGRMFISELHPFRQYQGTVANFSVADQNTRIPAFTHHISDFLRAASECGFKLLELREWWHDKDTGKPPRLVSFLFEKSK